MASGRRPWPVGRPLRLALARPGGPGARGPGGAGTALAALRLPAPASLRLPASAGGDDARATEWPMAVASGRYQATRSPSGVGLVACCGRGRLPVTRCAGTCRATKKTTFNSNADSSSVKQESSRRRTKPTVELRLVLVRHWHLPDSASSDTRRGKLQLERSPEAPIEVGPFQLERGALAARLRPCHFARMAHDLPTWSDEGVTLPA